MAISFIGATQNSTISGNSPTLTLPSLATGDCIIVAYSVTRSITMAVLSSGNIAYTAISSVVASGNLNLQVFQRYAGSTGETTAKCSGTGNAQDGVTACALVFRGTRPTDPSETEVSTTGTSSRPDGPDITVSTTSNVIISCVGSLAATATVTAPTSFLNLTSTAASDTRSCTTAMSWVASTNSGVNTLTPYSSFTSAAWAGVTIALVANSTTWYPTGITSAEGLVTEARTVRISNY